LQSGLLFAKPCIDPALNGGRRNCPSSEIMGKRVSRTEKTPANQPRTDIREQGRDYGMQQSAASTWTDLVTIFDTRGGSEKTITTKKILGNL